tara:strand:+ start:1963 stop:2124 length:162 start_codon:yes stop_codon:yes gene_type:complete
MKIELKVVLDSDLPRDRALIERLIEAVDLASETWDNVSIDKEVLERTKPRRSK